MMASVQPFVSGAISKTINMPGNAQIKECGEAYMLSSEISGAEGQCAYRDGSQKLKPARAAWRPAASLAFDR